MKGLRFFQKCSGQGTWNVASYHSPHSMTWRWLLAFSLFRGDEARVFPLWWGGKFGGGVQWGVRLPWIGVLRFQTQAPMWYRDCYHRLRDKQDQRLPPEDRPLPHGLSSPPIISDGGNLRH